MNSLLRIVVDDRERDEALLRCLRERDGVAVVRERLPLGDYCVDGGVLFERKTAADFARSLIDGRLFSQASRLLDATERPALILQGGADEWSATGVRREAIQGAVITLMLIFDLPLFRAKDSGEAARILIYTGRQLMRLRTGGDRVFRQVKAKRRATRQRRVLQSLPGIGTERARALLEHFGSVEACILASAEELSAVDGIGRKTAEAIRNTVAESAGVYGNFDDLPFV